MNTHRRASKHEPVFQRSVSRCLFSRHSFQYRISYRRTTPRYRIGIIYRTTKYGALPANHRSYPDNFVMSDKSL